MLIDDSSRVKIIEHISNWLDNVVIDTDTADSIQDGKHKPFHEALFPKSLIISSSIERSLSTGLGNTFEECAKIISNGHRAFNSQIRLGENKSFKIEEIIEKIQKNGFTDDFPTLISQITSIKDKKFVPKSIRSDLYVNNMFFELKSPKPNKDQCINAVRRHLELHAAKSHEKISTYFAMSYNPWGNNKNDYNHSFSKKYLDLENHVLIGKEFWDLLGGSGTYEELVGIYKDVGIMNKDKFSF